MYINQILSEIEIEQTVNQEAFVSYGKVLPCKDGIIEIAGLHDVMTGEVLKLNKFQSDMFNLKENCIDLLSSLEFNKLDVIKYTIVIVITLVGMFRPGRGFRPIVPISNTARNLNATVASAPTAPKPPKKPNDKKKNKWKNRKVRAERVESGCTKFEYFGTGLAIGSAVTVGYGHDAIATATKTAFEVLEHSPTLKEYFKSCTDSAASIGAKEIKPAVVETMQTNIASSKKEFIDQSSFLKWWYKKN